MGLRFFLHNTILPGDTKLKERMSNKMKDSKFAELDGEQLQELNELEDKLGVTLVAYDANSTYNSPSSETTNS